MGTWIEGGVCAAKGFRASGVPAGIRKTRPDLAIIACDEMASAAAVFTQNQVRAWCIDRGRAMVPGWLKGVIVNSGNANACNGEAGRLGDQRMGELAEAALGGPVLTSSTGVIGRSFPIEAVERGIPVALEALRGDADGSAAAARAIMTTDLVPKECALDLGGYRLGGIAKGSGMIAPNMATMLGFLTTDAEIAPDALQRTFSGAVKRTFNRVTVDGDTSTNDMAAILASGASGVRLTGEEPEFVEGLELVCADLAKKIARDGEGATKLVEVRVSGAKRDAARVARTIAESPLVKTALFGNDPNWGRILAAAGRSGVEVDSNRARIVVAGIPVFAFGTPTDADLAQVSQAMAAPDLAVEVDLGELGGDHAVVWTCDFSYDYVRINADYTT